MMTTNAANATVIELATHPVWRSSRRYSCELAEAMRRHPSSYRLDAGDDTPDRVPTRTCARAVRLNVNRRVADSD